MGTLKLLSTNSSICYAWRNLAQRAGLPVQDRNGTGFDSLDISVIYAVPRKHSNRRPTIYVVPCRQSAASELLSLSENRLRWLSPQEILPHTKTYRIHDPVPVLFWGEGCEDGSKPFVERRENGDVVFHADILAATFFMLSRWEETVTDSADEHGRFPATASVAYRQGFLDRPIVDEYAQILGAWLRVLLPDWQPRKQSFRINLTHDIDAIKSASLRMLASDIVKRKNFNTATRTLKALITPRKDQYLLNIYRMAQLSQQNGFKSSFYFMSAEPSKYNAGYDPTSSYLQSCIRHLEQQGHEVGFHPGYESVENPTQFKLEKEKMDKVLRKKRYGGRQHFLRFRVPDTWRQWEDANLSYDSSLGYADHEGFRCGTCHAFRVFDVLQDRELNLLEIPLIIMDVTLRQYRQLTPEQGREIILLLAKRCKQVDGIFTLLWHNTSLDGPWKDWRAIYKSVLPALVTLLRYT